GASAISGFGSPVDSTRLLAPDLIGSPRDNTALLRGDRPPVTNFSWRWLVPPRCSRGCAIRPRATGRSPCRGATAARQRNLFCGEDWFGPDDAALRSHLRQ